MSARTSDKPTRAALSQLRDRAEALGLYRKLLLARLAEERIRQEYATNEIKTPVHLAIGQEAIPVGVCSRLPHGSKTFGTYRNHALYLMVSDDLDGFFAELYGRSTGPGKGKAGSMHLAAPACGLMVTSAVVATTIPVAVGAALANSMRGCHDPVAVFFGDGAMEEGVFWESVNFACLRRLRVLFVCEDNGLAIHTPASQRQGFRSIPEAVQGFRCHVAGADGSSVLDVMQAAGRLLQQMAEEPGPGLLHATYFRRLEHVGPREDFDAGYRRRPSDEELERLDPVWRFERDLREYGCSVEELARIKREVDLRIGRCVAAARAAPFPSASELYEDVYAPSAREPESSR